jgi:hypothetical protein
MPDQRDERANLIGGSSHPHCRRRCMEAISEGRVLDARRHDVGRHSQGYSDRMPRRGRSKARDYAEKPGLLIAFFGLTDPTRI